MYIPEHFNQENPEELRALMAEYPLAALVSSGPEGMTANHIPLLFDPNPAPLGTLRGHLARSNPQWKQFPADVLAIFQGPQAYISPNWYPTKLEHGRVVPTWNYAAVHVRGEVSIHPEPEWLRAFLDRLTATNEASQLKPWMPSDAPEAYIDGLLKGIVGIEIAVTRIEGKWKTSQNQPEANRKGAADGLEAQSGLGNAMASLIRKL